MKENFEVPEGVLVAGVPGKIIRDLTEEEIEMVKLRARSYLRYVYNYKQGISGD